MKYVFFIGCTTPYRENNYELSARLVLSQLNIGLVELPGQSCCGLPFRPLDHEAWVTMASRNLALASKNGDAPVIVLCSGCYKSLKTADKEVWEKADLRKKVNRRLAVEQLELIRPVAVKHIAEVLHDDYGADKLGEKAVRKLNLTASIHPGCHITMPSKIIKFDNPQLPTKLSRLVEVTGTKLVRYETERLCCGATIIGIDKEVSLNLVRQKVENISGKVDALVTFCPICHVAYDVNQAEIMEPEKQVPVLHFTQLLGLAMGIPSDRLGFDLNRVDVNPILKKLGEG